MLTNADQRRQFESMMTAHSSMRFEFGVHDCAVIARKTLEIVGRRSLPIWRNERDAFRLMGRNGLQSACADILGKPSTGFRYGVGDIGFAAHEDQRFEIILCVHDGVRFLTTKDIGFKPVARADILGGWVI